MMGRVLRVFSRDHLSSFAPGREKPRTDPDLAAFALEDGDGPFGPEEVEPVLGLDEVGIGRRRRRPGALGPAG